MFVLEPLMFILGFMKTHLLNSNSYTNILKEEHFMVTEEKVYHNFVLSLNSCLITVEQGCFCMAGLFFLSNQN